MPIDAAISPAYSSGTDTILKEAARQAPRGRRQETREQKLKRVLAHTRVGQFTKAMRRITSSGIGDSSDSDTSTAQ